MVPSRTCCTNHSRPPVALMSCIREWWDSLIVSFMRSSYIHYKSRLTVVHIYYVKRPHLIFPHYYCPSPPVWPYYFLLITITIGHAIQDDANSRLVRRDVWYGVGCSGMGWDG